MTQKATQIISIMLLGGLSVILVRASCSPASEQGDIVLTYQLWNRITDEPMNCEQAQVGSIEFTLYPETGDPIRRKAGCQVSANGKGTARVSFPSGTYRELGVRMLRSDGGPSCLGTLRKATWTFRNGDSLTVPHPGRVVLETLQAQFDPGNMPTCGNGTREACEDCDDGNTQDGDGCSAACEVEQAVCGNGVKEPGEDCDDGNTQDGDGCSATCTSEDEPDAGSQDELDAGSQGEPDAGS